MCHIVTICLSQATAAADITGSNVTFSPNNFHHYLFRAFLSPPRASQRLVQSLTINKWPVHCVQVSNTGDLYYHKLQKCLLSSNNLP